MRGVLETLTVSAGVNQGQLLAVNIGEHNIEALNIIKARSLLWLADQGRNIS
jgi:hypothetical protein